MCVPVITRVLSRARAMGRRTFAAVLMERDVFGAGNSFPLNPLHADTQNGNYGITRQNYGQSSF
jgi:hypothetical protein